ncbi:MAG: cellulose biosynthesis cyclic di-GMP-binding regulatory protein BcsB, partial [Anaerolineales bacterium]|nr:cellulose biosynthesis cyclic di-GMP-binding regulatory protein BcsB [Anaerolineales bacterium]
ITYRASKDYDTAGYLEILPSPQNNEHVILTVLGNKQQGLDWAASALLTPSMREQLHGNFALVNDTQIYMTDKRPDVPSTQPAIPSVTTEEISVTPAASTPSVNPPLNLWQISTIVLVFIVVVLFVLLQRKK